VLTNTVMHATKMPVRAWVGTIFDLCSTPAGVSARDVSARWGITEKSAWGMLMRVREAVDRGTGSDTAWIELPHSTIAKSSVGLVADVVRTGQIEDDSGPQSTAELAGHSELLNPANPADLEVTDQTTEQDADRSMGLVPDVARARQDAVSPQVQAQVKQLLIEVFQDDKISGAYGTDVELVSGREVEPNEPNERGEDARERPVDNHEFPELKTTVEMHRDQLLLPTTEALVEAALAPAPFRTTVDVEVQLENAALATEWLADSVDSDPMVEALSIDASPSSLGNNWTEEAIDFALSPDDHERAESTQTPSALGTGWSEEPATDFEDQPQLDPVADATPATQE